MTIYYTAAQVLQDFLSFEGFSMEEVFGREAVQVDPNICYTRRYSNVFKHRTDGEYNERRNKALKRLHRFTEAYSRPVVESAPHPAYEMTLYRLITGSGYVPIYAGNDLAQLRNFMFRRLKQEQNIGFLILTKQGDVVYPDHRANALLGQMFYQNHQ